jgi:hypothetical protein
MDEQERAKVKYATVLAMKGSVSLAQPHHYQMAERVVRQVILPLLRATWGEAYGLGRDDEAAGLGIVPNPFDQQ